ncbi:MAG: redoxin domain-containing protein [Planctomycetes bacterium]|nr:redoxin domain-containing protein [Planctomycetota bacterium]
MNALSKLCLLSALSLPVFAQDPPQPPAPKEKEKAEAPKVLQLGQRVNGDTTLFDLDGKPQKAHDLLGTITVVNFYSIQCPIQRDWDRRLADIQKEFESKGVTFLHIDSNVTEIGEEPPKVEGDAKPYAKVREHLKAQDLPFRVLADHGNKVADLFDAKTTPHIYVFGKNGKLVYKGLVDDDQKDRNAEGRNNYLRDVLGKLLADEKVEPFATKEQGCTIKRVGKGQGRGRGKDQGD